jgi:hypothetical protein
MKGDFTRITFDPTKHYSRVLEQQGRTQVDSDFNEMNEIHRYFLRRLAGDLIGPHGGPGNGFNIDVAKDEQNKELSREFEVASGHYYVDGVLCQNDGPVLSTKQRGSPLGFDDLKEAGNYLAYLDVWERHVTAYEDEDENKIGIREVALRGPDTATRTQVVWQVKSRLVKDTDVNNKMSVDDPEKAYDSFREFLGETALGSGQLRARALRPKANDEPCLIAPGSRYRGAENQLYRVEIHHGGIGLPSDDKAASAVDKTTVATFKWSRENGSVIFPIRDVQGEIITLRDLGRDSRFGLRPDDWVEIVDDDYVLRNRAEPLLQIKEIDRDSMQLTLKTAPAADIGTDLAKHPLLRRWDQPSEAIMVVESTGDDDLDWIFTLEDGVQIQFPGAEKAGGGLTVTPGSYRTGDYWLIPARVATGDVEWPGPPGFPRPKPPDGVEHAFAPLRLISLAAGGKVTFGKDLRRTVKRLWLP